MKPILASVLVVFTLTLCSSCRRISVCANAYANADTGPSPAQLRAIERMVTKVTECRNSPGVSLAIVQDGETVLARGFGKADLDKDIDVTGDTIFPIASMSKQFTATMMAMILAEKNLAWETKVREILPDFRMPSDYMTLKTSLEDLVGHRTGLPENDMMWISGAFTRDEAQERLHYFEPMFEFRNHFLYNGMTFSALARVCKKLTGMEWEHAMRRLVFEPLNMTSSTFYDDSAITNPQFAKPYVKYGDEPFAEIDRSATAKSPTVGPAGSIASTANDMAKYMRFLTSGGKFPNGTIYMFKHTLKQLFEPLSVIPQLWLGGYLELPVTPYKRSIDEYAHAWILGSYRGKSVIYHLGNLYGYDGMLALYPDTNSAVFTVVNGPMGREAVINNLLIHDYIADILMGEVPWLDEDSICTYPAPWKPRDENYVGSRGPRLLNQTLAPTRPLEDYVGTYGNLAQGNVTVLINAYTGMLQLNYGSLARWKLFPSAKPNVFNVEVFGHLSFMKEMSTEYIYLAHVKFDSLFGNPVESLSVSMFNYGRPPTFHRGLLLSDGKTFYKHDSDCALDND